MPSQEEYLDNLLKGIASDPPGDLEPELPPAEEPEAVMRVSDLYSADEDVEPDYFEEEDSIWGKGRIQVGDTAYMSVEDIERLLSEGEETAKKAAAELELSAGNDLMEMLDHAEDTGLHEIHDLLRKSDDNEAIDESVLERPKEEVQVFDPYAEEEDEPPKELSKREQRAKERRRAREEKRAIKAAKMESDRILRANQQEEEKAAKQAAKEQKKALQEQKRAQKAAQKEAQRAEKARKAKKTQEEELPLDMEERNTAVLNADVGEEDFSLLDGILQDAGGEPTGAADLAEHIPVSEEAADGTTAGLPEDSLEMQDATEEEPQLSGAEPLQEMSEAEPLQGLSESESLQELSEAELTQETTAQPQEAGTNLSEEDQELMELLQLTGAMDLAANLGGDGQSTEEEIPEKAVDRAEPEKKAKKGFFARMLDFFTEEEEEETDESAEILLSDENQSILEELENEEPAKGKKGKKKKKGKGDEEAEKPSKKAKKAKKEKPKKEKAPKEKKPKKTKLESLDSDTSASPGSNLNFKKVLPVVLACLTFGVAIFILTNLTSDYTVKKAGREAYYSGDYQTCYENLYGKDLNSSEQIMFSRSESILRIRLWISEYQMFADEGSEMEALDSLIQSVNDYPTLYSYAVQWNAGGDVAQLYQQIVNILNEKYHLTEAQAQEIAAVPDDVEYTKRVHIIVEGGEYGAWELPSTTGEPANPAPEILPDALPEEEGLGEIPMVDNL